MSRNQKRMTLHLPEELWDFIESDKPEWESTTNYIRRLLLARADAVNAKDEKPKRGKGPKNESPQATWQQVRDRVSTYLLGVGEREWLANVSRHHDSPDEYWQEFHAKGSIIRFIEQMEAWESDNKKPAEAG